MLRNQVHISLDGQTHTISTYLSEDQAQMAVDLYTIPVHGRLMGVGQIALKLKVKHNWVYSIIKSLGLMRSRQEAYKLTSKKVR